MNSRPLVSVLIPCFNAQNYIAETLDSVINQTYQNLEIIIVDDGSMDLSRQILLNYQKKDDRIRLFFQENKGPSAARNVAFEISTGEWIQYLDADDLLHSSKIEKQIEIARSNKFDDFVIYGNTIIVDDKSAGILKKFRKIDFEYPIDFLFHETFECGNTGIHLIKRTIIEKVTPWEESARRIEDLDFFCRVITASSKVLYSPDSIFFYRVSRNKNSLTKQHDYFASIQTWKLTKGIFDHLWCRISDDDLPKKKFLAQFMFRWFWTVYPDMKRERDEAKKILSSKGFSPEKLFISSKSHFFMKLFGLKITLFLLRLYRMVDYATLAKKIKKIARLHFVRV